MPDLQTQLLPSAPPGLVAEEFQRLLSDAHGLSENVAAEIEALLQAGLSTALDAREAIDLLTVIVGRLQTEGGEGGPALDLAVITDRVLSARERLRAATAKAPSRLALEEHNGIRPHPVLPSPVFHQRRVQVMEGFARTRDIKLWDHNERIDIHLAQFRKEQGRGPTSDELFSILSGALKLPGVAGEDEFKVKDLARSIAANGVRRPPIIDDDGTLLDGNRRVAACLFILESDDYTAEEKGRAERIVVWQLTEHATEPDREAVIVSLNFESDHKEPWPEYVKAQKIYDEWEAMLAREPRATRKRQIEMKRELGRKFALETNKVTRYISMMEMGSEFEDHHINDRLRDPYEVKHRSSKHFQYFEELDNGHSPGGVRHSLNQDPNFKGLVFDLLYDGKFNNWREIRALKHMPGNPEAMAELRKARDEADIPFAQEIVEGAVGIVTTKSAQQRQTGLNTRIESFCDWFQDLPIKSFDATEPGSISPENLGRLHRTLGIVEERLRKAAEARAAD